MAEHLWAPFEELNIQDPYPMYGRLRENDPIHKSQTGEWIITDYHIIRSILRDKRYASGNRLEWLKRSISHLKNNGIAVQHIEESMISFLLMMNPPEHTELRNLVISAWNKQNIESRISQTAEKLLSELGGKEEFNIIQDYAQIIPITTMCEVIGIESNNFRRLKELGNEMLKTLDLYVSLKDLKRVSEAAKELIDFFSQHIQALQKHPKNSILLDLKDLSKQLGIQISDKQLVSVAIFLFVAGVETSASLIGTGIKNLYEHKDQLERLKNEESLAEIAIEELLRFDGPVQIIGRIALEEVVLGGKIIPRGSYLTLCLAAANRDPKVFKHPERLDFSRKELKHLAFGHGIHYCLGDWLGKLQGKIAIQKFIKRFPNYSIPEQQLEWNNNLSVRSLKRLRIRI